MASTSPAEPKPLDDKIALVTGASRGIGRATALALADLGATIVAVARPKSQGALEELDDEVRKRGRSATLVPMDLAKGDDIDKLCAALYERFGRLDILIGNAGVINAISPLSHIEPKAFQQLLDVNITANYRLMRGAEPLLKASQSPLSLYLTSGAAGRTKPYWGPYAASKAALEVLALTYGEESAHWGHALHLVDPGRTATRMRASAMPGEDPSTLPQPEDVGRFIAQLAINRPTDKRVKFHKNQDIAGA